MTKRFRRTRINAFLAAVTVVPAIVLLGASISMTLAQRAGNQFATTEFRVTVAPRLELEGSVDGVNWSDTAELTFSADQMALQVGEENAVYAPMLVRAGAASNAGATATVTETGLSGSDFADALRGEVFVDAPSCDAAGTGSAEPITTDTTLRGQESTEFDIAVPEPVGRPGAPTELCVKVWLNDNNWLLGGTVPPTETATWTVTGVTS